MTGRRAKKHKAVPAKRSKPPARPTLPDLAGLDAAGTLRALIDTSAEAMRLGVGPDGKPLTQQQYRMMQSQIATLALQLGELDGSGAVVDEKKIVKLPAFRRVVAELVGAVEAWPEAVRAVGETLGRLERGEAAGGTGA